ncbi:MAG: flagellar biosynthesis protein FlhB [Gammaproteobacteria bacterium]|nr:flagellar biosynthesis protein FlhB [Gammaproteobacteria bacterium]MDH3449864.1 flagellar biosynthesis protein FlhB [Gammaproteobacteria bacterium]
MANESDSGQEKTEQPTPKKLRDAKQKGQVPRSKELNSMTVTVFGSLGLLFMGSYMIGHIAVFMRQGFTLSRDDVFSTHALFDKFDAAIGEALTAIGPFLLLMTVVAIFTPLAIGGWSFSVEALAFKGDRINPLAGLKRIFSAKGLMELVKSLAKFTVVSVVATVFLWSKAGDFIGLGTQPLTLALQNGAWLLGLSFLVVSSTLILIAAIDVPFQLWDHAQKLKMTLQEVRDELKDTEGKPEVKSKLRQVQQEMAQRRMMEAVPKADVIITNPTHYAVALKYDHDNMAAPLVVAMGKDLIALKIREIAMFHGIEIFEAPPLARALYATCKIDREIPSQLYFAVAQVLAFVFQLRIAREQGTEIPQRPDPYMPADEEA